MIGLLLWRGVLVGHARKQTTPKEPDDGQGETEERQRSKTYFGHGRFQRQSFITQAQTAAEATHRMPGEHASGLL